LFWEKMVLQVSYYYKLIYHQLGSYYSIYNSSLPLKYGKATSVSIGKATSVSIGKATSVSIGKLRKSQHTHFLITAN